MKRVCSLVAILSICLTFLASSISTGERIDFNSIDEKTTKAVDLGDTKDVSVSSGSDCGWLDKVEFAAGRGSATSGLVYVLVTDSIYTSLQTNLTTYKSDLENEGYTVTIHSGSWTTIGEVRTLLQNGLPSGLVGAVLVGNIPIAWYKIKNPDSFGAAYAWETFPIDLYYADLNGTWTGTGTQTAPFTDHTGNVAPEIWIGRLYASTAGSGDEVTLLKKYFYKNHNYRLGSLSLPEKALVYVDDTWWSWADSWDNDVGLLYANRTLVKDNETTRAADYKSRLAQGYEWVSAFTHSCEYYQAFYYNNGASSENVYNTEITTVDPHAFFYNLFACKAANYSYSANSGYIGGRYLFSNTYSLMVVSSTKVGSMLEFDDFYSPLGNGKTIGEAFKDWFIKNGETGAGADSRAWFYGMTLLGDPTLRPKMDRTPPTGSILINSDETYATTTSVTLTLSASDAESGVAKMCFSNDGTTYTDWEAYATSKAWSLTTGDGTKTVYVKYKNGVGLVSSAYSDSIILDTTAPTGSIVINAGATYTTSTSVTLTLSASDTTSGVAKMCFSNDGTYYTPWEAYATSKAWSLTAGDGTKTVYVKYKDNAGLVSSAYSDTIILDTTAPSIIATTPSNNAVGISLTQNIVVQFSEEINTGSVSYTCSPNPGGWTSSWNAAKDTLTLAHTKFSSGVTYTFSITAAKDLAGNDLVSGSVANPWTFTTVPVIEFNFNPGSNFFTLPFVNNTIKDAKSLANAIGKNCTAIAYWDTTLQRFVTHAVGTNISNFDIKAGVGYMVSVSAQTIFTFTGDTKISSVTMSLSVGWNAIGRFNDTTTNGQSIGSSISNCTHVAKWNATSKSFDVYVVNSGVNNFSIKQGEGYLVYVTEESQWVNN